MTFYRTAQANGSQVHNAAALFSPAGEIVNLYHKTHFAQGYGTNPACYVPGDTYPTAPTPFGTIGQLICFDRHFPEVVRSLAVGGATLVLNPSFGGYDKDRNGTNTRMLQTRAYENHVYYIFTNAYQTLFISPEGALEAFGDEGSVTYHTVTAGPGVLKGWPQRRPETYAEVVVPPPTGDPAAEHHAHSCPAV